MARVKPGMPMSDLPVARVNFSFFRHGEILRKVSEAEAVEALMNEVEKLSQEMAGQESGA